VSVQHFYSPISNPSLLQYSTTMASRAAATSHVEISLSSLSSDLLMRVANYLGVKELCVFDTATENSKQLRAKYLSGLRNDTFLYPGADVEMKTSEWQEGYTQWLTMRHVFVNSISLNEQTTATAFVLYDTMNRVNPSLATLTIYGNVTFPKDMAVRNKMTLHKLALLDQGKFGTAQLRKFMRSVLEWESVGGSLQELKLVDCTFGNEAIDFGKTCDALTELTIENCSSTLSTTPGDSLGCTRLLWGLLHTCKNLKTFQFFDDSLFTGSAPLNARDLCLLARFCPHLEYLHIQSDRDISEAALGYVAMKCTKLVDLQLHVPTVFTDRTIDAITNLVSLRTLYIHNLQLQNPYTLRGLVGPQLKELHIRKGNAHVTEAELLYLVQHTTLRLLQIGQWEHLYFRDRREELEEIQPYDSAAELLLLGVDDPEALLSSQQRLKGVRAATQQPEMDTVDKLKAAGDPFFTVILFPTAEIFPTDTA